MKEESNNNYCVYQHVCPDGVYYGVTKNVKRRWFPSFYRGTSLEPYIERFGWRNIEHSVVRENLTYEEAIKIEDELIVNGWSNGTCLNDRRSGHYTQTDEFIGGHNARCKSWRDAHPEEYKTQQKAWRDAHPNYQREYYKRKKEENNNNDK